MAIPQTLIEGQVVLPNGSAPASGSLIAKLSQAASALDGADSQRVASSVRVTLGADGSLPAGFGLCPNDAIVPSGTYYRVRFDTKDDRGVPFFWEEKWQLASSPNPIDIGAVPRLDVVPGVSLVPSLAAAQEQVAQAAAYAAALGTAQIDGGTPTSIYGGVTETDGGTP